MERSRSEMRWVAWAGVGLALIVVLAQVADRADRGRLALLKWKPSFEALERGEPIYLLAARGLPQVGSEPEGYPTPPITALVLSRFLLLGDRWGAMAYAAAQLACAAFIVLAGARLARGSARRSDDSTRWPVWAWAVLVALSLRLVLSDVNHGNTNLIVAAAVTACAVAWARGAPFAAGLVAAVGTAFKVTPALLVVLFVARRDWRALAGFAAGLGLLLVLVPGLFLGFAENAAHLSAWARQMLVPYLAGHAPGVMQSEHINQSLYGLLARLTIDAVAIEARGTTWPSDVRIALVELGPAAFRALVLAAQGTVLAVLGLLAWRRGRLGAPREALGVVAALALGMLLLSERSWKHHHVLALLAVAYLVDEVAREGGARRAGWFGLGAAAAGYALSGSFPLGARGSDLAEAWGAFTLATLVLFIAVATTLLCGDERAPSDGSGAGR